MHEGGLLQLQILPWILGPSLGFEVVAKRLEYRRYQTPRDPECQWGLAEKPYREPYSIAARGVLVCQLKIGPQISDCYHDIGQHSGRKIRIQTCQCARGLKPIPEALSLGYPRLRPA